MLKCAKNECIVRIIFACLSKLSYYIFGDTLITMTFLHQIPTVFSIFCFIIHDFLTFCQANAEKMCKTHEVHLAELQAKIDEQSRSMSELSSTKSKMMNENDDVHSQLEDAESQLGQLSKVC